MRLCRFEEYVHRSHVRRLNLGFFHSRLVNYLSRLSVMQFHLDSCFERGRQYVVSVLDAEWGHALVGPLRLKHFDVQWREPDELKMTDVGLDVLRVTSRYRLVVP
jgi:hypothetical protein